MSKAKKRVSRRSKTPKRITSSKKRISKKKPISRTKSLSRKAKRKVKERLSFSKLWKKLGDDVLRAVKKEIGWDQKTFAARLARDPELSRLVVERTIRLLVITEPEAKCEAPFEAPQAAPQAASETAPTSNEDELANEYASYPYVSPERRKITVKEPAVVEEKADWRLF